METINLLFVIDDGYVDQLKVTLYSIKQHMPEASMAIYLMQKTPLHRDQELSSFCHALNFSYYPILVDKDLFKGAPTTDRYPDTIYYRLLAHEFLPADLKRILYLDADILCLNPFNSLYTMDLGDHLYAAASHNSDGKLLDLVNKLRLQNFEMDSSYYNTGVLLMNLPAIRHTVKSSEIFAFIEKNRNLLILPDQDVLNGLYADKVTPIPDEIYNYDARYSLIYQVKSNNAHNLDWVIQHTVFLHFAGRDKPWKPNYNSRYAALYKYLERQSKRFN